MTQIYKSHIYVVGDVSTDHNIYVKPISTNSQYPDTVLVSKSGGAGMLYELLESFKDDIIKNNVALDNVISKLEENICELKEDKQADKKKLKKKEEKLQLLKSMKNMNIEFCFQETKEDKATYRPTKPNSFLLWQTYQDKNDKKKFNWHIDTKIGFGNYFGKDETKKYYKLKPTKPANNDYLIIDDAGLEFQQKEENWKPLLESNKFKQIILKMSSPAAYGPLFHELITNNDYSEDLTIITSAYELRRSGAKISKGISWEQSITDLVVELEKNPELKQLKNCNTLIVTFATDGAFYLKKENGKTKSRLIFDKCLLESEFLEEHCQGGIVGFQNTFTAAFATGLALADFGKSNTELMIEAGLSAARKLIEEGHVLDDNIPSYPYKIIAKEILNQSSKYSAAFVPQINDDNFGELQEWSILKGNYKLDEEPSALWDESLFYVLDKKNGLANVPQFNIGHFFTVDRKEIEGLRNIKQMVLSYDRDKKDNKPLSFAVFGAPGSGKSFVVKQLEKGIPVKNTSFLEFNLSQFANPNDIIGALHQVRDEILRGKMPFVFWDEFDSKEYFWLQYLLAPMQDGQFQEGQITHYIGRCVFVFAGGTSYDFEHFGIDEEPVKPNYTKMGDFDAFKFTMDDYNEELQKYQDFKLKKGPDFKSRLNGYLNVMGPNQNITFNDDTGKWDMNKVDENDVCFPLRRANLFNALSGFDASKSKVDFKLLNAILHNPKYLHGARSFEKVVKTIFQGSNGKMSRSNLPSDALLKMHVKKEEFLNLLDIDEEEEFVLLAYKIAPFIHENWLEVGDNEGWKLEYHKAFEFLPSHLKKDNVAAALRIPKILKVAGYEITNNAILDKRADFETELDNNKELLDKLAKIEHKGWMDYKKSKGWNKGTRNDDQKLHNCIAEYDELPDNEKEKDRESVKNIPTVLSNAGLYIKKIT